MNFGMNLLTRFSVVCPDTTVFKVKIALACCGLFPSHRYLPFYLSMSGIHRARLRHSDTMGNLLAGPLTHFFIHYPLLGGSRTTQNLR
jgi:hypothetical protein